MSYRGKIIWYGWDESGKLYYMIKEPGGGEKRYRDCLGAMEEIDSPIFSLIACSLKEIH